MSGTIIQLNEDAIQRELKELVRSSVEETLNNLPEPEASELLKAERHVWLSGSFRSRRRDEGGDAESRLAFLRSLKERGLSSPRLFIGDRCSGLVEAIATVYPKAKYQRRTVHFYRNMFSVTPRSKTKTVAAMIEAIHAQEDKAAARENWMH